MNQTDHINLIHKQLSGEISASELDRLNQWVALSEDNKFIVESITLTWNNAAMDDGALENLAGDIDLDYEFSLLDSRIKEDLAVQQMEDTPVITMRRKYWSVAAGFALLIGIATTVLLMNDFGATSMAEISTGNETKEIILADGSSIRLNANSSLSYPIDFDGDTREVSFEGEAFFDIAKDPNHPFIIHTPYEDVTVLGTSFNVRAYEKEPNSQVAVATGKVKVSNGLGDVTLLPNEKVLVDHSSGVMAEDETIALNELSWFTNTIVFEDALMPDVLDDLSAHYNIGFDYDYNQFSECHFTSTFVNEELSEILTVISKVLDCSFENDGAGNYILVGGGCQ